MIFRVNVPVWKQHNPCDVKLVCQRPDCPLSSDPWVVQRRRVNYKWIVRHSCVGFLPPLKGHRWYAALLLANGGSRQSRDLQPLVILRTAGKLHWQSCTPIDRITGGNQTWHFPWCSVLSHVVHLSPSGLEPDGHTCVSLNYLGPKRKSVQFPTIIGLTALNKSHRRERRTLWTSEQ